MNSLVLREKGTALEDHNFGGWSLKQRFDNRSCEVASRRCTEQASAASSEANARGLGHFAFLFADASMSKTPYHQLLHRFSIAYVLRCLRRSRFVLFGSRITH